MSGKTKSTQNLVFSGLFIALGMVLPYFTGQIPQIGRMLLPMHIPVLLCGFLCGPVWGAAVGLITPLLRSATLSMPPMLPTAAAMAFELMAYGGFSGFFYNKFPKRRAYIYISLVLAMILGRIVWGGSSALIYKIMGSAFTWKLFVQGAFLTAIPGIILQIIIIPPIVMALKRTQTAKNAKRSGKHGA